MVVVFVDITGKDVVVEKCIVRLVVRSVVLNMEVVASVTGSIVEFIRAPVTCDEVVVVLEALDVFVFENIEVVERVNVFPGSVIKVAS